MALATRRLQLFPRPVFHLFDLAADGAEQSDLWNSTDAAHDAARRKLLELWDTFQVHATDQVWQDDGPLASPDIFDGSWAPWRDEHDLPYATYQLLRT